MESVQQKKYMTVINYSLNKMLFLDILITPKKPLVSKPIVCCKRYK